jgi:hypothetical protein
MVNRSKIKGRRRNQDQIRGEEDRYKIVLERERDRRDREKEGGRGGGCVLEGAVAERSG